MRKTFTAILSYLLIFTPVTIFACTTWSSVGESSYQNATLVAKNRDAPFGGKERLEVIHPKNGISYLGLMYNSNANSNVYPDIAAGINKDGLVIVNNSAVTLPIHRRDAEESKLMTLILTKYSSVKDVLNDQKKLFLNSQINDLLIADKHQTALIEVGNKHYGVKTVKNGTQAHANSYVFNNMKSENKIKIPDSQARYNEIQSLLKNHKKPLNMEDFINMSYSHKSGPLKSIFRLFTVATWISKLPQQGDPNIYVRFTNPTQKYNVFHITLDEALWNKTGVLDGNTYGILSHANYEIEKNFIETLEIKK